MGNVLQQLLSAELKAQAIVEDARRQSDQFINDAKAEVKRAEQRFEARIPEIHASFIEKAEEKVTTHIDELDRRYLERRQILLDQAQEKQQQVIDKVVYLLLNAEQL